MGEQFKVVFTGRLPPGVDAEAVSEDFSARVGIAREQASALLTRGQEAVLKTGVDQGVAERFRTALERIGLVVRLQPMPAGRGDELSPTREARGADVSVGADDGSGVAEVPSAPTVAPTGGAGTPRDPYSAPAAGLIAQAAEDEISGPNKVPASHGWRWLKGGFWHFRQNPFAWILALVAWTLASIGLSWIPYAGSLLVTLISPLISAGFLVGAAAQEDGDDFRVEHLLAGLSHNPGQLVLLGVLYLVGVMVAGLVMGLGLFAVVAAMGALDNPEIVDAIVRGPLLLLGILFGLLLAVPLVMAYWFAPALVALDGFSAVTAMKLSFQGCWKNVVPFLVYGILSFLFLLVGVLPVGLGLLVVLPLLIASLYVSYRDIYYRWTFV